MSEIVILNSRKRLYLDVYTTVATVCCSQHVIAFASALWPPAPYMTRAGVDRLLRLTIVLRALDSLQSMIYVELRHQSAIFFCISNKSRIKLKRKSKEQ